MFLSRPGALPGDGPAEVAGVRVPAGHRVLTDDGVAVAWITDGPIVAEQAGPLIRRLVDAFPTSGLWPLFSAPSLAYSEIGYVDAPTDAHLDAVEVLHELDRWAHPPLTDEGEEDDDDDPVPRLPGLAALVAGHELTSERLAVDVTGQIALVAVARPADVLQAIGWQGAINYDVGGDSLSAVLRSWEDRFGATLIGLEGDTVIVQPARLPADSAELERLAGEHYAFCPDVIDQGIPWSDYLNEMPRQPVWTFWWD